MTTLTNDFKFVIRQLLKKPGFTVLTELPLFLGMGLCMAVYSQIDATERQSSNS